MSMRKKTKVFCDVEMGNGPAPWPLLDKISSGPVLIAAVLMCDVMK